MEQITVECNVCNAETKHSVRVLENTPRNVVIEARCTGCDNLIKLPLKGGSRLPSVSLRTTVETSIRMTKRHEELVKTPAKPTHYKLKDKEK